MCIASGVTSLVFSEGAGVVAKRNRRAGQALPDMAWARKVGKHPNVVVVLGCDDDGSIIRMSHGGVCLGCNERTQPEVLNIVTQVLCGLNYLSNSIGVVHMDIKPGNLLLDQPSGAVRICDLGGLMPDGDPFPPVPIGTPFFMTPDCARSDGHVSEVVPLWALGVCAMIWLGAAESFVHEESCACLYRVARLGCVDYERAAVHRESSIYKYWRSVFALRPDGRYFSAACTSSIQQLMELVRPRRGLYSSP